MAFPFYIILLNIIVFILLFFALLHGYTALQNNKTLLSTKDKIIQNAKENEEIRKKQEQKRMQIEGFVSEEENFFLRLDHSISQSGIKQIFPFLTTEIFLAFSIILSSILGILGAIFFNVYGFIIGLVLGVFLFFSTLYVLKGVNYNKTENEILTFMNLIDNYSKTSDDIISIFGKIIPYINAPLKQALEECYAEARSTGDTEQALENLQSKIEHPKFKELIQNLEVTGRHQADYTTVIQDERIIMQEYLADKKERKSIMKNARIELLTLVSISIFLIYFLESGLGASISSVFDTSSFIGWISWILTGFSIFYSLYTILGFEK